MSSTATMSVLDDLKSLANDMVTREKDLENTKPYLTPWAARKLMESKLWPTADHNLYRRWLPQEGTKYCYYKINRKTGERTVFGYMIYPWQCANLDVEDFLEKLHKENTDSNIRFDANPIKDEW